MVVKEDMELTGMTEEAVIKSVTSLLNVISLNLSEYELKYTPAKKKSVTILFSRPLLI